MERRERIAVLVPARDAERTLPACLSSIARQTDPEFRCIVVDDGSTDATADVVLQRARHDDRFCLLRQERRGIVAALQFGLAACDEPLVARMDADDVMHRERLRLQRAALDQDPGLAGVGCHARAFPSSAFGGGTRAYMEWLRTIRDERDVLRERFVESPLLHPTWMLRTETLRRAGYRDGAWAEDYDAMLRMLGDGARLSVVPRTLHAWRRSESSATNTDPRYSEDARAALKAARLCDGPLAASDHYVLWGHGGTGRRLRRALLAHGRRPIAVVELDPRKIGQRIDGAPVVSPDGLAPHRSAPILVSVAHSGPRAAARRRLADLGLVELRDFFCCA